MQRSDIRLIQISLQSMANEKFLYLFFYNFNTLHMVENLNDCNGSDLVLFCISVVVLRTFLGVDMISLLDEIMSTELSDNYR